MRRTHCPGDMQPGEVALFHFEGKSRIMCGADGSMDSAPPTRFASKEAADAYANEYVARHPRRGCRMYDSAGTCIGEIRGAATPAQRYTRAQAKRDVCIGVAGFVLIPAGFLFDKWIGWGLFLGMALATKFVMLGIVKLSDGIAGLMESKPR
jgi:hypothetical protein